MSNQDFNSEEKKDLYSESNLENHSNDVNNEINEFSVTSDFLEDAEAVEDASRKKRNDLIKYVGIWTGVIALFFLINFAARAALNRDNLSQVGSLSSGSSSFNQYAASGSSASSDYYSNNGDLQCSGNCCGSQVASTTTGNKNFSSGQSSETNLSSQVEKAAIDWYAKNYGEDIKDLKASLQDFGCHQQIKIFKGENLLTELRYQNGQFSIIKN